MDNHGRLVGIKSRGGALVNVRKSKPAVFLGVKEGDTITRAEWIKMDVAAPENGNVVRGQPTCTPRPLAPGSI